MVLGEEEDDMVRWTRGRGSSSCGGGVCGKGAGVVLPVPMLRRGKPLVLLLLLGGTKAAPPA